MELIIKNGSELEKYINNLSDDVFKNAIVYMSDDFIPELEIRLTGENFNSSINTTIMQSFLKLQKTIYMIYSLYTYKEIRSLSNAEKEALELFVKIEKESSNIKVFLEKLLSPEVFNKMSESTKKVALISFAIVFLGISGLTVYNNIQEKKVLTESQSNAIKAITENYKETFRGFTKLDTDNMIIQGQNVNIEDLKYLTKQKKEPELIQHIKLSGMFRVLSIHFDYLVETSFMEAQYIQTGEIIKDINLQDCKKLEMIKNAERKEPIKISVSLTRKGEKVQDAHIEIDTEIKK
jgi:hypothetical protein